MYKVGDKVKVISRDKFINEYLNFCKKKLTFFQSEREMKPYFHINRVIQSDLQKRKLVITLKEEHQLKKYSKYS